MSRLPELKDYHPDASPPFNIAQFAIITTPFAIVFLVIGGLGNSALAGGTGQCLLGLLAPLIAFPISRRLDRKEFEDWLKRGTRVNTSFDDWGGPSKWDRQQAWEAREKELAHRRNNSALVASVNRHARKFEESALQREIDRRARELGVQNAAIVQEARQLAKELVMVAEQIIRTHDEAHPESRTRELHPDVARKLDALYDEFIRRAELMLLQRR